MYFIIVHVSISMFSDCFLQGYFTGTYNAVQGNLTRDGHVISRLSGKWSEELYLQQSTSRDKDVLFNAVESKPLKKIVAPESEQEEFESRRLWTKVTDAIITRDQEAATIEKSKVEDHQRMLRANREEDGTTFVPRFFKLTANEVDWEMVGNVYARALVHTYKKVKANITWCRPNPTNEHLTKFIFEAPPPPAAQE